MPKQANKTFRITGRVIDRTTRQGIAGLRVEAWDKDLICDDLVGSSVTDEQGAFQIEFTSSYFAELFLDRQPDLFFKVFREDELIKSTEDSVLWNVVAGATEVVIEVNVPAAVKPKDIFVVRGHIAGASVGQFVRAYDKDFRGEEFLGKSEIDAQGDYEIRYRADKFQSAGKGTADLRVAVCEPGGRELVSSEIHFNAAPETTIDLTAGPGPAVRSEYERHQADLEPVLQGVALIDIADEKSEDKEKDLDFLAGDSGIDRQHIAWLVQSAKLAHEFASPPEATSAMQARGRALTPEPNSISAELIYGCLRQNLGIASDEFWARSVEELIVALKKSIAQHIVQDVLGDRIEEITVALNAYKANRLLKPSPGGQSGSLGDLLGTMPRRLSPEKEIIVATVIRDLSDIGDAFVKRLREAEFDEKEVADVQVTRALGEITQNHTALVEDLQLLRTGDGDASLRYLASQTPQQWQELVDKHGVPSSLPITPQIYAEQLERAVEAKHPTAVFAARVKDDLLQLNDSRFKAAANFLVANPELELAQHNARSYVANGANMDGFDDQEQLVNTLQGIQSAQKLSAKWAEAGVLLNSNLHSALNIVQQGPEGFKKAVEKGIPLDRAADIYNTAQYVHDTTIALIGNVATSSGENTFDLFAPAANQTDHPALKDYPNLRTLFGNLDTCACAHCQSVLSPAAYFVDVLRFLEPKELPDGRVVPLLVLLARRPDLADLELTCANTNTEIPYIDLTMEILENAVGLPIEIPAPYGFDAEVDFKKIPLEDNVVTALREVLSRTAISVGEHLVVKEDDGASLYPYSFPWAVTDGTRTWGLQIWPDSFRGLPLSGRSQLNVPDYGQAVTLLDQGKLPAPEWLIPANAGEPERNLPIAEAPAITKIEAGRKWEVQYKRSARVEIRMGTPMGSVILKTAQGQQLDAVQTTTDALRRLANSLSNGQLAEPLTSKLPQFLSYQYSIVPVGSEWEVEVKGAATLDYYPKRLEISSLTYQSSGSHDDLKASPENRNPEAYGKLDTAAYPWTLPFNLWLEEVRAFLERRGISRLQLMEQSNPASRLLDDAPADAIAREVLGLSKSEAEIIVGNTKHQDWEFWGLQEQNNSVTDLNDESTVTGSWIHVLTRVSILLQRSSVSYRELLNVLQTGFVQKVAPTLAPGGNDCNTSKMGLVGLTVDHLDRIHRFVRLRRKLGWSVFELDLAISAVTNDGLELTAATLRGLSHLQRLHLLLGLPVVVIARWQDTLITARSTDHTSEKRPEIKSVYEQLFQNPAIQNPPDPDFVLNKLSATTRTLVDKTSAVAGMLGMRVSDLTRLSDAVLSGNPPALSLANLASLYRNVSLARALGLTVRDYVRALNLIDADPFQSFKRLIEFVEAVQSVLANRFAFTFEEIDYLLRYTTDSEPTSLITAAWNEQTLSDVRASLQTAQKETFSSAEPPAEHLRKTLTRLGWYSTLIEEAIDLLGSSAQFEVEIPLSTPSTVVTIPQSLEIWVSYLASERKLIVSGKLDQTEWSDLLAANAGVAVTNAIGELRTSVSTFSATLPQHQHHLQSLNLPTHRLTYSSSPDIPAEMSARCYYDLPAKEVVFVGWMTEKDQQKFKDPLLVNTLQGLQDLSNEYEEPPGENSFLSANDLDTLFTRGQTPESRIGFILDKLASWFTRETLVERLSAALGLEQILVRGLLSSHLDQARTLDALLDPAFVNSDPRVAMKATSFPDQFQALGKVHKAALICSKLGLKPSELSWLTAAQSQVNAPRAFAALTLDDLPIGPGDTLAAYNDFQSLLRLFELRDSPQIGADLLAKVLKHANKREGTIPLEKNALHRDIAEALQMSAQEVINVASTQIPLRWRDDYLAPVKLSALLALLLTIQRLGGKANEVFSLTKETPGLEEATLARHLLRALFDARSWPDQLKPIEDGLREKRRAALVAHLIARDHLRDASDLYDRYLIDVEMGPCKVTTRVLHAISAAQLFVQRCLMNLEEDVSPALINVKRWQWMKNYRVWEANRKVFLYPENWIEPELRDDKSELFKELEGQLLQNELDNDRAEEILKDYLKQLEDISRLAIVGMYVEKPVGSDGQPTGVTTVHIVGRTHNRPSHYFYRRWVLSSTVNYWTAWERVPLDGVKTDHILPFVMRGDVYIAWPEITQLPAQSDTGDNATAGPKWQLQMAWTRKAGRGWNDRYLSQDTIEHPWVYGKDENQTFTFRVRKEPLDSVEIDCYAAQRGEEGSYNTPPDEAISPIRLPFPMYSTPPWAISPSYPFVKIQFSGLVSASYGSGMISRPIQGATVEVGLVLSDGTEDAKTLALNNVKYDLDRYLPLYANRDQAVTATDAEGRFNFSLALVASLGMPNGVGGDSDAIGFYRNTLLDCKPTFLLRVTVASDLKTVGSHYVTETFFYFDPLKPAQKHWTEEQFQQNIIFPMKGDPPGGASSRPVTMKPIRTFNLLDAEDAKIVPLQGDPLLLSDETLTYASGYRVTAKNRSGPLLLPDNNGSNSMSLWQGVSPEYFLLPAFPANSQPPEVVIYSDSTSSYFIRRETTELDPLGSQGKYQILLNGHPTAGELRRVLARSDIPNLFDLAQQSWSSQVSLDGHTPTSVVDGTQSLTQPAIRFEPDEAQSPYASYNTELFFHVPFLIANYLSNNQRFEEAQRWFHLVFDPATNDPVKETKRYWRYLPFREHSETTPIDELLKLLADPHSNGPEAEKSKEAITTQIQAWLEHPFLPHAVARLRPRAYEFAVVFKYLDNLIAWADRLFRQSTTESINEATQLYILVAKLLGARPQNIPRDVQAPALTYRRVAGKWDDFSNAWCEVEANLPRRSIGAGVNQAMLSHDDSGSLSLTTIGMLYFCVPDNEKLQTYWDTVENRLFNIRHCRNIEGVEQQVPLFQPPIDPGLLVRAVAAGLDISTVLSDLDLPLPYYRFSILAQKASELCGELKALSGALLSALEKKDAEQLALLRSNQEIELLSLVKEVKEQQIEEAKINLEALHESEKLISVRFLQYQKLLGKSNAAVPDDPDADVEQTSAIKVSGSGDSGELSALGITQAEQDQFDFLEIAHTATLVAGGTSMIAGILHAIPQSGTAVPVLSEFGGQHLGAVLDAVTSYVNLLAGDANHMAGRVGTIGQYQRRQDEWVFQSRLALKEIGQVRKQIIAAEIRRNIAEKELNNHEKQIKNAQDADKFMRDKYTNQELYQWMVRQVSDIYFRTYQLAFDVAKRAERAFRHELGLQDSSFVKFGYWDNLKKGLMVGDQLFKDLKRMEVAYLDQNKREYEITKHVSLLQLDPTALITLRQTGKCELRISETIFDLDFPGHYMRRIKMVSLTIPCVTGPYSSVPCTLTLLKSEIRNSNLSSGDYGRDVDNDDSRFTDLFGSIQSIVTSAAQNDSGLFEPNLRDERYLPFEGAGVISTWRIELPSAFPTFDYDTITDVVLHVRYTARNGGDGLKQKVATELQSAINSVEAATKEEGMARLFSLRQEFPTEWHRLISGTSPNAAGDLQQSFAITKNRFPFLFAQKAIKILKVDLYAVPKAHAKSPEFPATIILPDVPTPTMGDGPSIGNLLAKTLTLELAVDAEEGKAKWQFKIAKASVVKFQKDIDDILMVCHYSI